MSSPEDRPVKWVLENSSTTFGTPQSTNVEADGYEPEPSQDIWK